MYRYIPAIFDDGAPAKARLKLPQHGLDLSIAHSGVVTKIEAQLLVLGTYPTISQQMLSLINEFQT